MNAAQFLPLEDRAELEHEWQSRADRRPLIVLTPDLLRALLDPTTTHQTGETPQ